MHHHHHKSTVRELAIIILVLSIVILCLCGMLNKYINVNKALLNQNFTLDSDNKELVFDKHELTTRLKLGINTLGEYEYYSPVDSPIITSGLELRVSPITGILSVHTATDMYSEISGYIYAVRDGQIINHWPPPDGFHKGHPVFGGYIELQTSNGIAEYGHMSETYVKEGEFVKAGDKIGFIGNTGLSRGVHLHFDYHIDIFGG